MTTGTRIGWIIVGVVALGGALAVINLVWHGVSARDEPTAAEAFIARRLRRLAIPGKARGTENPIPRTEEVLSEGRAHFADHCAIFHGNDGRGGTPIGRNLCPKAPDMVWSDTQSLSDGEIFYIIKNGIRLGGMPAWGDDSPESDRQTWHLVHFIRHLPRITQEEIEEMKTLNPRSPGELMEEEMEKRFLAGEDVPAPSSHHHH